MSQVLRAGAWLGARPKSVGTVALIGALGLAAAWLSGTLFGQPIPAVAEKDKTPSVFVRPIKPEDLSEVLIYPARVEPKINAMVLADADGVITAIHTPLGATVRSGQALLTLKNVDPAYRYAPMTVYAPVGGVVGSVEITVGSRVSRGEKLILVTDPNQVRVTMEVAAHDLAMVKPGLTGELRVQGTDVPYKVKVHGVSPFVDPSSGTAYCELDALGARKPTPGLMGRAVFRANPRKGFVVSESAVTYRGRDPFVRVVREGVSKFSPVILGRKQEGRVEITKGVAVGDEVIERASGFVADGEKVAVEREPASGASKPANPTKTE